jgi:acyl-CoA synthetase (NDP forming)
MGQANQVLEPFFNPQKVAIVGATGNPMKMNYHLTENLLRLKFQGRIYLVNPNRDEILGIKTWSSLRDIPDGLDLVIISTPASISLSIMEDCVEKGIKSVVLVPGGFSEGGKKGGELHKKVAKLAKENGIRVLGPNTLSPINTSNNLIISFHRVERLRKGGIAFVFQSGFYEYKLNWIFSHLGVSKILDLGNKMDINEVDALEYLAEDPETKMIAMHIESIRGEGKYFIQLLKGTSKRKPIVILKSGRSPAGAKAAASHTGAIAKENDSLFDSLLKQAGAIRAQDLEEFFDFVKSFDFLIPPSDNRIAVVNISGGEGVIATDACQQNGFQMAKLGKKTIKKLREIFPPWEIPVNPFDGGVCMEFHLSDMGKFFHTLAAIPDDENVDCLIAQIPRTMFERTEHLQSSRLSATMEEFVSTFADMGKRKPLALWRSSVGGIEERLVERLELNGIPVYPSSNKAAKALAALYKYQVYRNQC